MADPIQLGPDPTTYRAAGAGAPKLPNKLPPGADPGEGIEHFLLESLGLKVKRGKVIPGVNRLIVTWLAPQPVGIVPPQTYGLPEDYLFGFTPHQIIEAAQQIGPQELYNKLQFETRRELLHKELDKITAGLQLKQVTDQQLADLLALTPDVGDPLGPLDLQRIAIKNEQNRRFAEVVRRERLELPPITQPSIETRGEVVTNPAHVTWPDVGGIGDSLRYFGFIDALVSLLPPDP